MDKNTQQPTQPWGDGISQLPQADSHRLVSISHAEIRPGMSSGSWYLVVEGEAPCLNMNVTLEPVTYIAQPEYWRIEVVGSVPGGICLTAMKRYTVAMPLGGGMGKRGIEVVGQDYCRRIDLPPAVPEDNRRILQIGAVSLGVLKTNPPRLLIEAEATASTPLWGNPRLEPLSDELADDGYAEFEFVADPPDGPVIQVLSPIAASLAWDGYAAVKDRLVGVRVFSQTNHVAEALRRTEPDSPTFQEVVRLGEDRRAIVDDERLMLELDAIDDSRCPANAICVWQGFVEVTVGARARDCKRETVTLSSRDVEPVELDSGYLLRLVDVVPYPGVGAPGEQPTALVMVMRM